jgi:prepilin-type N-terminal cleavage/methylation domain-containing protein
MRKRHNGFSLIEVLIGAAILLVIAAGIAPLFTEAMKSNQSGREATEVSGYAISKLEEFLQLPFTSPKLVPLGGATERVYVDYYSFRDKVWRCRKDPVECPGGQTEAQDPGQWTRTTTIRQYEIVLDPSTHDVTYNGPLPGTAAPDSVHLKEIDVVVDTPRTGGPLGPGQRISVRAQKSM